MAKLTHFDQTGSAHMVDVSSKGVTKRTAIAVGKIKVNKIAIDLLKKGTSKKGDVLGVARLAGIMGAKSTSRLIPLCHAVNLSSVNIEFRVDSKLGDINIKASVSSVGSTGVEMEALTAVSVSALTIYDMLKSADKSMLISDIKLILKTGGKSGTYKRYDNKK
ncbi:MAG: cyclic pyranopterin monophosphate synthase MoaC [Pseudomonadota bacterium]|nr:cyclic pyranopterin monophosphate synthase MoaC [Pseudomonadota bacterium]